MDLTPNAAELKPAHISDAEWALRVQLAHCYHLVDFFGWTETIFNHISARLPGTDHYLVNPFGLNYDEVTPANLLKVDIDGHKIEPSPYDANPAGFALHGAIHGAREDIHCLIHTHTTPISAIAMKRAFQPRRLLRRPALRPRGLPRLRRHHAVRRREAAHAGQPGREAHPGAAQPRHRRRRDGHPARLLPAVDGAARRRDPGRQHPGDNVALPDAIGERCAHLTAEPIRDSGFAEKFFNAMVRQMHAKRAH
jgi:ribulose-5-phosphate 4-epimerase/fuculose-1-phosphate aldolase